MKKQDIINLFTAIRMRSTDVACDLINRDPTLVSAVSSEGTSIMTYTIQAGNIAFVKKLLEHHAEITELHFKIAKQYGFLDILHVLEEYVCEYDELSKEEKLRNTEPSNTELFSFLSHLEDEHNNETNTLRASSAPASLNAIPASYHPTFRRVNRDSSFDHITQQLKESSKPSKTHWSK